MATQTLLLASADNGQAWLSMQYDDVTMMATGVVWSNPLRAMSATIRDPTGTVIYTGTPIGQGSVALRRNQQFAINPTASPPVLPDTDFWVGY